MVVRALRAVLSTSIALSACGGDEARAPAEKPKPDVGCLAGEAAEGDGCRPPGVPPGSCAAGFEHDGDAGCEAVLPDAPCPPGAIAVPGDAACREVAPCGRGDWGSAPVDGTSQFVDASYAGADSDGTEAKPWLTIQDAVDAADPGSVVVVAAGKYPEDVEIRGKSVRLWGRCPALVEIAGPGALTAAIVVREGASGSEVHDLAVRGDKNGIVVTAATEVVLDRVWVHDTGQRGLDVEDLLGPAAFVLSRSLVEATSDLGVFVSGSEATVRQTVIRDVVPISGAFSGYGLALVIGAGTGKRSIATVETSLIEHTFDVGVVAFGCDVVLDGAVVRDTAPFEQKTGRALSVQADGERASATVRGSILERSHEIGVFAASSDLTIEYSVVRQTEPGLDGHFGRGLQVQDDPKTGERSKLVLRGCLLEKNHDAGLVVAGSDATLDGVRIRDSLARPDGLYGDGACFVFGRSPSEVTVMASRFEHSPRAGIANFGSHARFQGTAVACNAFALDAETFGGPPAFEDVGGNACGCEPELGDCQIVTSDLAPPDPVGPL